MADISTKRVKRIWAIVNKNNINLFQGPVQDRTFSARQKNDKCYTVRKEMQVSETNLKYRQWVKFFELFAEGQAEFWYFIYPPTIEFLKDNGKIGMDNSRH